MSSAVRTSGSLRKRLMITLIGGSAILAFILFLIVRSFAAQIAQDGQDNILSASVSSLLDAAVIQDGAVEVDFPYASFSMLDTERDDRVFYAIYQDGLLLSGYENLPPPASTDGDQSSFKTVRYEDTKIRLASANRTLVGAEGRTQISVSIAQTQDALSGTLNRISQTAAVFGTGFFLLIALLSYWATTITINPLMRLASSVKKRGPQDLSPFNKPVPSEMVPLVTSLNTLMGRLDHSLTRSEDFIAEAAHRVRTPLATVRSYADDTLQRVTKKQNRDALRSMVRAIDESSRAASQLLDHAMITFRADHLDRTQIDLVALVAELVVRLAPIAEMKDVELHFEHDASVTTKGDLILIQNAIRNLIDNALKYAPNESVISISVKSAPTPTVTVNDQGPGYPMEDIENLTTRFKRGKNAEDVVGSGLGLTIAKDVAIAHDGDLTLRNHEKGGACATLSL